MKRHKIFVLFILLLIITVLPTLAQESVGVSAEVIAAYPEPNVSALNPDDSLLYDRIYRRVNGSLAVYNGAGGTLVEDLGVGFTYVTLNGGTQGDWAQIGENRWLSAASLSEDVLISRFAGVRLPEEGLPYTMAWTLRHLRASEVAGTDESDNNPFMYRYTRVSLYAETVIDGAVWYQIGVDQWVQQYDVARILPIERPEATNTDKWVSVDLYEQVLIAYEGEIPVFATLVSSGLADWPTNEGDFNVYLRRERTTMSGADGLPDFYLLEEVPWTMFFDNDIALHGTYWHDGFGYRHSHGCVNMSITDANWIFNWSADVRDFTVEDSPDLSVHVYSSGQY
jgi:hypothetical protein